MVFLRKHLKSILKSVNHFIIQFYEIWKLKDKKKLRPNINNYCQIKIIIYKI